MTYPAFERLRAGIASQQATFDPAGAGVPHRFAAYTASSTKKQLAARLGPRHGGTECSSIAGLSGRGEWERWGGTQNCYGTAGPCLRTLALLPRKCPYTKPCSQGGGHAQNRSHDRQQYVSSRVGGPGM